MKTQILTSYKQEQKTGTKKRINIELICALLTLGAIITGVFILNSLGLIKQF
jgi:hypothetical protein